MARPESLARLLSDLTRIKQNFISSIMYQKKIVISLLMFFLLHDVAAQPIINSIDKDSVTLTANSKLQAGGLHRFLFGSLWRDVWATPIAVKVLQLNSSDCGFQYDRIIRREYDGTTIQSFLFKDNEGNEHLFTPVNQDSISSLPAELSVILPQDIVTDQISTLNPFALLLTFQILKAVGLPYRETRLVASPKNFSTESQLLDLEHNLGILEGPLQATDKEIKFKLDDLIETSKMIESLESSSQNRIDELQYLKVRLIDILVGDWECSAKQLYWYKIQKGSDTIWEPVQNPSRQAFIRINGLLPTIADISLPQLSDCGNVITSIENLTLSGRSLDRRLLVSYPKQIWDSVAISIQNQLTDSVLIQAISILPGPVLEKEKSLFNLLKERRNQMAKAANEFYKLSSAYVDINATNNSDRAEIRRIGRHMVSVALFDNTDTSHVPFYKRLFHDDFTKEIRILLLKGDDITTIEGEESSTIKVIIDGGDGQNEFTDKGKTRSLFGSLNLFSAGGTIYYDSNSNSHIKAGSTQVIRNLPYNNLDKIYPTKKLNRDWGSEWSLSSWLDINPDDGLIIGGGPVYTEYAYRVEPYSKQIRVRAGLATHTMRYRLDATGEFRDWFSGVRTIIQLHASQLDISNYFGSGNETHYDQSLDDNGYYKVDQQQIFLRTAFDFALVANTSAAIGSTIKLIDNNPKNGTLLNTISPKYYNASLTFLNLNIHLQTDSRDNKILPTQGIFANIDGVYSPKLFDNSALFYKLKGEVCSYYTFQNFQFITIAIRAAGEKIWENHPFFESAFLGGNESLRGFERQRFAGDASLMSSVEIRSRLAHIPFIVPLWIGISSFVETGRVFFDGEQSKRWHNVLGAGIWFSFIKSEYIANFSIARSEDKFAFYATMGFMF